MSTSFADQVRALARVAALAALGSACFAAGPGQPASPAQGPGQPAGQARGPQPDAGAADAQAPLGQPKVCVVVETGDPLTQAFADRLRQQIGASGALSLATGNEACELRLHVPGNLLRFETAGGVMVSTVVIVTASSGRYLSTSISACQANVLKPCAVRAVNVAKLALLVAAHDESAGGSE